MITGFHRVVLQTLSLHALVLAAPKGWKGLEGVNPPYWNFILSNSNIGVSNRLQWKTTLITPSTPSAGRGQSGALIEKWSCLVNLPNDFGKKEKLPWAG